MFEVATNTTTQNAIRRAHSERAQVFNNLIHFVFHPFAR
jgi:hypothetical protein